MNSIMTRSSLLCLFVLVAFVSRLPSSVQQEAQATAQAGAQPEQQQPQPQQQNSADELKKWEEFKKSNLYVPPFEADVISIPDVQAQFVRDISAKDIELFKTILKEAIEKRNKMAPSVSLMWKYSAKLMGNFIKNRQAEQRLSPRKEPKPEFFEMVAKLVESILNRSAALKTEKGYTKASVNTDDLYNRADALFSYVTRMINSSPVTAYVKWDEFVLFKNELTSPRHDVDFKEEAADLTAVSSLTRLAS